MVAMTKIMFEINIRVLFCPQACGTSSLPSASRALLVHSRDNREQEWKLEKFKNQSCRPVTPSGT